jgi:fatty acid desaturase
MAVTMVPETMVPTDDRLPSVLPSDRLLESGKPVPELRHQLRRIDDLRNVGSVLLCWAQPAAIIAAAAWIADPVGYVVAVVLMGTCHARLAILGHEAAHNLLFTNKRVNDAVGRWLLAYPAFVPFEAYRRAHFAHHKEEFGPNEPDMPLYVGYPITKASFRRKLWRDARGSTGWKNLRPLLQALRSESSRDVAGRILLVQLTLLLLAALAGRPELYLGLWLVPWLTSWRVMNRLRSIAEHGGMERSTDRRRTTHHVRQSWLARSTIVPFNTGWHLAHHVDMAVPWRNLPRLQHELVASGWVTADAEYPSYRAFWRECSSG